MTNENDLKNTKNQDRMNLDKEKPKVSLKTFFLKGLLFIFCAIPGLFIFLSFSFWIMGSVISPKMKNPPLLLTPLLMAIGIVLMLIGTGKLKQFKYSAVFLFIPISLIIFGYLSEWRILGDRTVDIALFVGLSLFFINYLIVKHYQRKREGNGINERNREQTKNESHKEGVKKNAPVHFKE